jgi:hypothetical protein
LSLFSNFEIKFIRQQVNMITQTVVRVAICWTSHRIIETTTPCIELIFINKLNLIW